MKVKIICVGKIKEPYLRELIERCVKELKRSCQFELVELKDEKTPDGASVKEEERIRKIEGERILSRIPEGSVVIPLCIDGKQMKTKELQQKWAEWNSRKDTETVFIIGGSLGLSREVQKRGNLNLSFSKMTFPHQLMRLILLEQLVQAAGEKS
ncbi:23S rRNA (pseudouridine(1915)-N(3))-methyltransferase RlmH [Anaerostipes sp.]|uniref:23S rRNA (pseudouridine(1915)-N(3))-methyltransferase RlmH n=1 Tax=Anaerostipes sp. TaxID=1872530 RepID=UPI0025B7DAA8|nr:23S rRNA (pseudouridine(1915)-N(3))-methyltransferase RlmH [Anaerostipes sp.]MBS7009311.1 23S rRNA (pseudouridine(1915)-N(3))-methyltransferase RlmH [Anaerostipes sp.]